MSTLRHIEAMLCLTSSGTLWFFLKTLSPLSTLLEILYLHNTSHSSQHLTYSPPLFTLLLKYLVFNHPAPIHPHLTTFLTSHNLFTPSTLLQFIQPIVIVKFRIQSIYHTSLKLTIHRRSFFIFPFFTLFIIRFFSNNVKQIEEKENTWLRRHGKVQLTTILMIHPVSHSRYIHNVNGA